MLTVGDIVGLVLIYSYVALVELFSPGECNDLIVPMSTASLMLAIEWERGA